MSHSYWHGGVLVRVAAAALNPLDVKLQRGQAHAYFPLTFPSAMGTDLAGTVEKTGSLTSRWRKGDRVMARLDPTKGGAFADYAVVPEDQLVLIPDGVDFNAAAGMLPPQQQHGRLLSRWLISRQARQCLSMPVLGVSEASRSSLPEGLAPASSPPYPRME